MAFVQNVIAQTGQSKLAARIHTFRETLRERAARRAVYRQTVYELQALSDRELADFGFHRSEIPRLARQAADEK
ncbi:hypothetical protein FIU97_15060 [Roseivivax sp. THAF40]|uniref:DUF1127 domain-containing protein n=1 Tax=unclassified Roseivivax TaxID=2639302 RepID=UPI00126918F4|nr:MULTISPECIES: DUF1127 domain-containing protein [unclassified Roseivivax]QFS84073.1 hypothetical protein FIV09_14650 [Roseivivax sp. THAF197b]QFT47900.1 hypothetical protein FIU97_15060 [Roseivivax sp. THAF40]